MKRMTYDRAKSRRRLAAPVVESAQLAIDQPPIIPFIRSTLFPLAALCVCRGKMAISMMRSGNYDPQSFAAKTAGKRLIVLVAGVTMNVILAMVLFTICLWFW